MTGKIKKIISTENGETFVADIEDIENRISQNSSKLETAKQELSNKCNEALSEAKAYTDQEKAKYLPLTGTAENASNLGGYPSTNYVRSINNISPDENGNVKVTTSGADLSGVVKSINNIHPDENGNISLNVFTTPGNIIKWESDYFDIEPSGLYSFDLSNTPFVNIPREVINIQMVGKVKTAQNGYKVDDYVYPQFSNYNGDTSSTEQGSTPYISGNVLSIKFGNENWFVAATPDSTALGINKTNIKVKLILTALIKEV